MRQSIQRPKATLRKRFLRTFSVFATLYLLACVGCASLQRRMIYYPPVLSTDAVEQAAKSEGLERWNDSGGKAIGWKRLSPIQPAQGQVLILHGNAGCAFQCGHYADVIQQAAPLDIFIVEFPGYADRPGKPTERSLYDSAVEGFQSLPANVPTYVVGESLGTGVATYLAGRFPDRVDGVALLAPYNRLADVAQAHMPILPVKLMLVDRFPSEDHLRNYHGPVASLVAGKDQVIPERFGQRLHDGYAGPKQLWEFPDGNHGTVMLQPPKIWKEIVDFWHNHSTSQQQHGLTLQRSSR